MKKVALALALLVLVQATILALAPFRWMHRQLTAQEIAVNHLAFTTKSGRHVAIMGVNEDDGSFIITIPDKLSKKNGASRFLFVGSPTGKCAIGFFHDNQLVAGIGARKDGSAYVYERK